MATKRMRLTHEHTPAWIGSAAGPMRDGVLRGAGRKPPRDLGGVRLVARMYRREREWDQQKLPAQLRAIERSNPSLAGL